MTEEQAVLLVDKPAGVTSHDVVAQIRRDLPKGTKVGHAGTLDPFATGLLIVLIGRATRTQDWFMGQDKEYLAEARFGAVSTTLDADGEITETGKVPAEALDLPTGLIEQVPPRFSALHVNGKRAHELARAGVDFELEPRSVRVELFEETSRDGDRRSYRIRCGSGTYIRSLVADLGDAYCVSLRRTAIGPFKVPDHVTQPTEPLALSLDDAIREVLPSVSLQAEEAEALGHGRRPPAPAGTEGTVAAFGPDGLVAIAEVTADGTLASRAGLVG